MLIGGKSPHFRFSANDILRLANCLDALALKGFSLMGTLSRRSSAVPGLSEAVADLFERHGGYLWDGRGENPYTSMLAAADLIVVSADSANMVSEALAAGRPVYVFFPAESRKNSKIARFLAILAAQRAIYTLSSEEIAAGLETAPREPIDSTPIIAESIWSQYQRFKWAQKAR